MPLVGVAPRKSGATGVRWKQRSVLCAWLLFLFGHTARAQPIPPPTPVAPSQVTPQNIAPTPPPPPPPLAITGPPAARAPAGADKITIAIGGIVVDGGFADMADVTEKLAAPYRGQTRTVADLYTLADSIEAAYRQEGYILARVLVPPQSLKNGETFHLKLVDGFIEAVDVSHVPAPVRDPIADLLLPLVGVKHLRIGQIGRALTLAAAVPGTKLRSALSPGKEEGGTRLVIEADYQPISGSLTSGNKLGPLFRDWEVNAQLSLNSVLGMGEQIYFYLSGQPNLLRAADSNARRRVAGGGITLPIGDDGATATLEATISDTKPVVPGAFFQTNGLFKRIDARGSYPIIKSRTESLTLAGAFEYSVQSEVVPLFGDFLLDEDRLNVTRLSLDWNRGFETGGSLDLFGQVSKGLTLFDVRTLNNALATGIGFSRGGASPNFTKAEAKVSLIQDLPYDFIGQINLHGQLRLGADAMPSSELFSIDGEDALSTLTSGSIAGDSGVAGRAEVQYPYLPSFVPVIMTPYLFVSAGQVFDKFETPGAQMTGDAYGAGLRLRNNDANFLSPMLSVEFGHVNAGYASGNRIMINGGIHY